MGQSLLCWFKNLWEAEGGIQRMFSQIGTRTADDACLRVLDAPPR